MTNDEIRMTNDKTDWFLHLSFDIRHSSFKHRRVRKLRRGIS
jgi:hypothetical protein